MVSAPSIWKIQVPKDRVISLINAMDADQDGYITVGEAKRMLKEYAKSIKASMRFAKK